MCDGIPHIVTQWSDGLFPVFGFKIHKLPDIHKLLDRIHKPLHTFFANVGKIILVSNCFGRISKFEFENPFHKI